MKSLFTLLLKIGILSYGLAQPIVSANILLETGERQEVIYSNIPFDPGEAGPNVTWDFSNIRQSYAIEWEILPPENTDFADQFPEADQAFFLPRSPSNPATSDVWAFYNRGSNGDEFNYLGAAIVSDLGGLNDTTIQVLNEDPDQLYVFPLRFDQNFTDEVKGLNIVNTGGIQIITTRSGTTTTETDAYGTLITPVDTFENVLRIKRIEMLVDSFMTIPTFLEAVRYDWVSPDRKYILYHTEEIIIRNSLGLEQNRSIQTYYTDQPLISSTNQPTETFPLTISPNPVDQTIRVSSPSSLANGQMQIIDLQGRILHRAVFTPAEEVSVDFLPSGIYLCRILNPGSLYQSKFIKL